MPFSTTTHSAPTTPLSHTAYLTEEIRKYRNYLDHSDPGVRLVGLHAIYEALDSLFAQENAPKYYTATVTTQPGYFTRLMTHARRWL